ADKKRSTPPPSGPLPRLEQPPVLEDRVPIGHAGDVVGHYPGAARWPAGGLGLSGLLLVLRGHESDVLKEGVEQLLKRPTRLGGHAQHLIVPVDMLPEVGLELQMLLLAALAQHRERLRLGAHLVDRA